MTKNALTILFVALTASLFAMGCGETADAPTTEQGTEAGGKGDLIGGESKASETLIADEITLIDGQDGYQLGIEGTLGQALTDLFTEAEEATGLELRATYHYDNRISCDGADCVIMGIDELAMGEAGPDILLTMTTDGGGPYYLHKMMVAAGYGSYDYAEYDRFSCTTNEGGSRTSCAIANRPESVELTDDISYKFGDEFEPGYLELRGDAFASLLVIFEMAQSEYGQEAQLRDIYAGQIDALYEEGLIHGNVIVDPHAEGEIAATLTSDGANELDGLYYLLKLMVVANLGDFETGASYGPFDCRYEDEQTICDIKR